MKSRIITAIVVLAALAALALLFPWRGNAASCFRIQSFELNIPIGSGSGAPTLRSVWQKVCPAKQATPTH